MNFVKVVKWRDSEIEIYKNSNSNIIYFQYWDLKNFLNKYDNNIPDMEIIFVSCYERFEYTINRDMVSIYEVINAMSSNSTSNDILFFISWLNNLTDYLNHTNNQLD